MVFRTKMIEVRSTINRSPSRNKEKNRGLTEQKDGYVGR